MVQDGAPIRAWSAAHGGRDATGVVAGWLRLVHRVAAPLVRRRVPPAWITLAGVVVALAVPLTSAGGARWPLAGVVLVLVSVVLDGLDGAVARATGTASARGRALDAVADRISDLALLIAIGLLGGPWWVPAALAVAAVTTLAQESVRARSAPVGLTVAERPVRVVLALMVLLGAGVTPWLAGLNATIGAGGGAVLGVVGLGQLLWAVSRSGGPDQVGDDPGGQRDQGEPAPGVGGAPDEEEPGHR